MGRVKTLLAPGSITPVAPYGNYLKHGVVKHYNYEVLKENILKVYEPGVTSLDWIAKEFKISRDTARKALGQDFVAVKPRAAWNKGRKLKTPKQSRNFDNLYDDTEDTRIPLGEWIKLNVEKK